ncbi:hypothetical protein JYU34_004149 [Plutella xylostella]|uniref:Cyclic nucleotide-binding domain-containing protein n=1 Tax=Plutella xylostella TaxID=51655 RepID=A0ABQ7QX83_PLUXY|nr:hypothetical protein JYU34_004149 [Plutella xylostella]
METFEDKSSFIYKYRHRTEGDELSVSPTYGDLIEMGKTPKEGEQSTEKKYSLLHENRTDFAENRLRYIFVTLSGSGWQIFVLVTIVVSFTLSTSLFTFCEPEERPLSLRIILGLFSMVFAVDVLFEIWLKFSTDSRRTLNLMEPDTCRVVIDGILALPYAMFFFIGLNLPNVYAIIPLVFTIRLYRLLEYFYISSSQAGRNQWSAFIFQYLVLFLTFVHLNTCIWYLMSYKEFDVKNIRKSWSISIGLSYLPTETKLDWYLVSLYWSVMLISTNALGDIYPETTTERTAAIIANLLGFFLTSIVFVGSLTSQFITITTRRSNYVRQLRKIQNHLELIKMDTDVTKRILGYYEDLWYQKSGVFKPQFLRLLPSPLRMEICYDLNYVPLYSSLIFRNLPEPFLRRLSVSMSHRFYLPGDIIFKQNENKNHMVCITSGMLEFLSDEDDESPIISFGRGTCFGEIALVYNVPARSTIKAATYVECQVLDKTEFIKLMITYPNIAKQIREEINERICRCVVRKSKQEAQETFTLNVYGSKSRKKASIKCLKEKLRYLQGQVDIDLVTKEDQLDENCIDLYVLSEHVKKKNEPFTCLNSDFPLILHYDCYVVKIWEATMLILTGFICIVYPYRIALIKNDSGFKLPHEIIVSVLLITNIVITCCTAIKTKKKYLRTWKKILNYRLNTLGFFLDLTAIVPFECLVTIQRSGGFHDNHRSSLYYLCKAVKLCLVWRLSSFFEDLEKKLLRNTILVKIIKYCVYLSLLCYWCGIILYMESCFVRRCSENSWFERVLIWEHRSHKTDQVAHGTSYPCLTAVYFASSILLSLGFGDLTPADQYDMALVAFLSVYGVLLLGYCVAEFSSVITHWSRTKTAFLEIIITIEKFMTENNMHRTIKRRILNFYDLQWQYNLGAELTGDNWLEQRVIPEELRKKVLFQARFKALTSIRFFQVKNKAYIHTLAEKARDIILPPGEIVFYGGTVSRDLYIIESGFCLITSKSLGHKNTERIVGPGNHLGLLVLLYGVPAVKTVITLTHCKLITIGYAAYTSTLSLYPEMREHDGLLSPAELQRIEALAKEEYVEKNTFYKHLEAKKVKIRSLFQEFLDNSFINVKKDYQRSKESKESYSDSFKDFKFLKGIASHILVPVAIRPDGTFLKIWTFMRISAAYLICLLVPTIVAMDPVGNVLKGIILTLEIICYVDIFIRLHVAYYGPQNQLIYHPYKTAKHYLKGPFIVDLLTSFPWYMVHKHFLPSRNADYSIKEHLITVHMYQCIFRMFSVTQIYKLFQAFAADSIAALKRTYLMSVLQFFLLTLFFLNFYTSVLLTLTCRYVQAKDKNDFVDKVSNLSLSGQYMFADYNPEGNMICKLGSWIDAAGLIKGTVISPGRVYLLATYWTASCLSGAGFGDITPQDTTHTILALCLMCHGVLFFGYVYARIASQKATADQVATRFQEKLKHFLIFMRREGVPVALKRNLIDYWRYQWKRTGGWSHQSILGKLHANLNEDAVLYMYERTLQEIPLFEGVETSFFRAFAKELKELYFQKGYVVMRSNEVIETMYIIYRGKVDITSEDNEVEACMGPGGIFGNIRGVNRYLTMSHVTASRNIDLLAIDGSKFYTLLKSYPSVLRKVKRSIENARKDYVIPTISEPSFSEPLPSVKEEAISDEEATIDDEQNATNTDRSIGEDSHGSKSITSHNIRYIPVQWLLFKPHRWFRSSILPDSYPYIFLEYLSLIIAFADFIILVYQIAFQSLTFFFIICVTFDVFFIFKLFLDVHCGYINRYGDYVLHPKKIRKMFFSKKYLRRRDFLSNLHVSYLAFALNLQPAMQLLLFSYLRGPQLFRITYLFTYQRSNSRSLDIGSTSLLFKLGKIGMWAAILSHVNACLFFKLSCLTPVQCTSSNWMTKTDLNLQTDYAEQDYFALYMASLWYMVNLITITGTGDVTAQNDFEIIETIIIIIVIKFSTGLLISEMSAMITAHSSSRIEYDYGINELRDGLRDMNLSDHQMTKMWDYVRELWSRQLGKQIPDLVIELPFTYHWQLMQAAYGSHINSCVIFAGAAPQLRRTLASRLRHCVYFPDDCIAQCGRADHCLYFIHRGEVEVLTVHPNLTESVYDVLGPEDSFGIAQGLFVGVPHHFTFRARTVVDIVYLKLDHWKYLLDFYPKSAKIIQRKVENVYLAT